MTTANPTLRLVPPSPIEEAGRAEGALEDRQGALPRSPPLGDGNSGEGSGTRAAGDAPLQPASLVAAIREGDVAAARTLYALYEENVRRLLWQLLGQDPELEDVLQQVFLAVAESLHRLAKPESLGSWIVGITLHTARREIRRRQRWRRHGQLGPLDLPQATGVAPPVAHQRVARIQRILGSLPADERIVFVLRYAEEYQLEEIAAACGCSLATVKRRLDRARKWVRARAREDFWLAPLLEEEEDDV